MAVRLSVSAWHTALSSLGTSLDGGSISIYGGYRPPSASTPVDDQEPLVVFPLEAPAFFEPAAGELRVRGVDKALVTKGGEPRWFRAATRDGIAILDGDAGGPDDAPVPDLRLDTDTLILGGTVSIDDWTLTAPG